MNLYLITRPDVEVDYDEAAGYVVAASTPAQGRQIARSGLNGPSVEDEEFDPWLDPSRSTIRRIGAARTGTEPGIILRDFRAG